jgi:hypothetical protein
MDHFLVGEGVDLRPSVMSVKMGPNLVGGDIAATTGRFGLLPH